MWVIFRRGGGSPIPGNNPTVLWEGARGFLEQQQPPEGWDTLKLGLRISPIPAVPGMSRDSGHGFTSPFPSCVPVHQAGMCWIWEDAVSRRVPELWGCWRAWMDQNELGMLSVTLE